MFSKNCKHLDDVVIIVPSFDVVKIHGILVPPKPDLSVVDGAVTESADTLATVESVINGGVSQVPLLGVESNCFDINLLTRGFSNKLCTIKCIPPKLRLGFAKIFCSALENVPGCPGDLERCQFEYISRTVLRWRDPEDRLGLVLDRLAETTPSFSGEAKHPHVSPPGLSYSPLYKDAPFVHKDLVLNRIHSFPKGTSCGRDGLRAQHLKDILGGAASAVYDDLLGSITRRRLVSKVVSSSVGNSLNTYLQDFQFGVSVPGGCMAVLHSVNRLVEFKGYEAGLSMLLVNFKNAFNLVDMSVLLQETRDRFPSIAS
uniref:Reverse transcriptase domain-containing protein n=1 Tax=Tanacetum cinerariifolium TaxID=118510 RepID=A0A6L2J036_TANCI|nr:hypothetical protein [Tanacetum cinerariifolium]